MGNYIDLGRIQLIAGITCLSIQDVNISTAKNKYGVASIKIIAQETEAARLETGENPSKVAIKATMGNQILFQGVCASYELAKNSGYSEIIIHAFGNGSLLDREKKSRNFQNPGTLRALAEQIVAPYGGMIIMSEEIELKGIESQQNETDWEFLLRLAGREGLNLYENSQSVVPCLMIGKDTFGEIDEIPDAVSLGTSRDIMEYSQIQMNVDTNTAAYQYDASKYSSSGVKLIAGQTIGNQIIVSTGVSTQNGQLVGEVELIGKRGNRSCFASCGKSSAVKTSIMIGKIIGVDGTDVQVQFESESEQDTELAVWMPYENTMNNYFYCMPDIGDKVYCYYEDGGIGVCLGCLRTDSSNPDLSDSKTKMITTQDDMIRFMGTVVEFLTNRSMYEAGSSIYSQLIMDQAGGISMHSNGNVIFDTLDGTNNIEIDVQDKMGNGFLEMYAVNGIVFQVENSTIGITAERIDIKSPVFYWEGYTKYSGYEYKEDEYQDWFDVGLDVLQFALDLVGMLPIPGVSLAADLINAGISLARGDTFGCIMSLVGAIPVVGSFATAGKFGKTAAKAADTVGTAAKRVEKVANTAIKTATKAMKISKDINLKILVKTVKFMYDAGQALYTDLQVLVLFVQGDFDPLNDAEDAQLLLQSMRGNLSVYKNVKDSKKGKAAKNKANEPEGKTNKQGKTQNDGKQAEGKPQTEKKCINDPVDVVTGSMSIAHTDMNIRYRGGEFEITRFYESVYRNEGGNLGNCWFGCMEERLCLGDDEITVLLEDIHLETFRRTDRGFESVRNNDPTISLSATKDGYCYTDKKNKIYRYFDEEGKLVARLDRNGNGYQISYCGNKMSEAVFSGGAKLSFQWTDNKISKITDAIGRSVSYRYEGELLKEVTCIDGGIIRYEYTPEGRLHRIYDQNGKNYVTNEYDRKGRVVRQVLSTGEEFVTFYDDVKKENTFLTVSTGERIVYTYDYRKLPLKEYYADGTYAQKEYDQWENVIYERDRLGNETRRSFDEKGRCIRIEYPDGGVETLGYNEEGYLTSISDSAGSESCYEYDSRGNLTVESRKIEEGIWQKTIYTLDEYGRRIAVTDANGNTGYYTYGEQLNEALTYTNREGTCYSYRYDKVGRLMEEENASGIRSYGYDPYDRIVVAADEEENTTRYSYDHLGNLLTVSYPVSQALGMAEPDMRLSYDDLDHPVLIRDAEGGEQVMKRDSLGRVLETTGAVAGQIIRYEYDENEEPIRVHFPDGGCERRFYDANGNLVKRVLPEEYDPASDNGAGTEYTYDGRGRLLTITGPDRSLQWKGAYDHRGNLTEEEKADGSRKHYRYNHLDWLVEERTLLREDEQGRSCWSLVRYEYDLNGNCIAQLRFAEEQTEESAQGRILRLTFSYDKEDRLIKKEDGLGAAEYYYYDSLGRMLRSEQYHHSEKKLVSEYTYSPAGNILTQKVTDVTGRVGALTTYTYDENGNQTGQISPLGHRIHKRYDRMNRLIEETHEGKDGMIQNSRIYRYDTLGNLLSMTLKTAEGENVTEYTSDTAGRISSILQPDGSRQTMKYDRNGRVIESRTPTLEAKGLKGYRYGYDLNGNCTEVIGPDGRLLTQYSYTPGGLVTEELDGAGEGIRYGYDLSGRRIQAVTTGGSSQEWKYNPWGEIEALTDGNGHTTDFRLDAWGRAIKVTTAEEYEEQYTYDPSGNILSSRDGEGNEVTYGYDGRGNMILRKDALGSVETFAYDSEGNLILSTDRNGISTRYSYTMYGGLTERYTTGDLAEEAGMEPLRESYGYTAQGFMSHAIAGGMRYDYRYDAMGRLLKKSASGRTLLSYTYDEEGHVLSMEDISGRKTRYSYDLLGRLMEVYDRDTLQAAYTYDASGRKQSVIIGKDLRSEYAYNADGILSALKTTLGGQVLADNQYYYDGNGNLTRKETQAGTSLYAYDRMNRLSEVTGPHGKESFAYDRAGNRIRRTFRSGQESLVEQYRYTAGNRLMSVERLCGVGVSEGADIHADMPGIRKESFTYDKQGNLLSDGQATYTYDAFNRMERAELKDGRTQINHYDAEGLRAEMEENGRLVKFLFNPDKEVVAEESEGTIIRYIRGLGLISSDSEKAKTYYHYASDEMGSITHVVSGEAGTDENGTTNRILNHYEYDAFGNTIICEETVPNRFRYTGQQYDPVTAQYYLRVRYYNPVIGRFLQEDSYYGDGLNLFSYCHNNPLMYYDPSGNSAMAICPEKYNELSERQKAGEKLSDEEMAQMKRHERGKDNPYYQAEYQKNQSSRAAYTEANPGTAKGGKPGKGNAKDSEFLPNGSRTKWGAEHGRNNVRHNNAIEHELDWAEQQGATDIKKNSFQVDIAGKVVKGNKQRKPDASYTLNGKRININYVSNYELDKNQELNRELKAFLDMCKADPSANNVLVFQYPEYDLKQ